MAEGEGGAPPRGRPLADERWANAYAEGYGEGIRDALKEILGAVRSGTPQEIRWQVQSRLARIPEDVELKRRALLGPPPRGGWEAPRRPAPAPAVSLTGALEGSGVLYKEAMAVEAPAHVAQVHRNYGRVVAFGRAPQPPLPLPEGTLAVLVVGGSRERPGEEPTEDLASAAGRLDALLVEGPTLVYCDCVEYLCSEYGEDVVVRSLGWIAERVRQRSGRLVISVDPSGLRPASLAQLQRALGAVR